MCYIGFFQQRSQTDDQNFKFKFSNSQEAKTPDYSYNWPYDYFSLVELAKVTGIDKYAGQGATDWQDYKTRVYLISGMIRTLQENPAIATFPFAGPHDELAVSCRQ